MILFYGSETAQREKNEVRGTLPLGYIIIIARRIVKGRRGGVEQSVKNGVSGRKRFVIFA